MEKCVLVKTDESGKYCSKDCILLLKIGESGSFIVDYSCRLDQENSLEKERVSKLHSELLRCDTCKAAELPLGVKDIEELLLAIDDWEISGKNIKDIPERLTQFKQILEE